MFQEENVVEIEFLDEEETFDLEVDHPSHTFYANGVSVSNSHALCYSIISFQTAWMLTYYPIEWACAVLNARAEGKDEKKEKNIAIVRSLGFEINPPDINLSEDKWVPGKDDKSVIPPLTLIKGLGQKEMEKILKFRPYQTIEDLLFGERKINKKALDGMIRIGALDHFIDQRFNNRKHFWQCVVGEKPSSQKKWKENIQNFANEKDFSNEEKILDIYALTGIYPIHLVLSLRVKERLLSKNVIPIAEFQQKLNPLVWFIPIRQNRRLTSKKKKPYWEIDVIDDTGMITKIKCWTTNEKCHLHRVYLSSVDGERMEFSDQWNNFSIKRIDGNLVMMG